jgi:hypothetical protein
LTTGWAYGDVTLFKTTDKGENYFPVNCGTTILNGFFLDSLNGWVGGHFGTSKSTNGGNTWYHYAQTNGTIMALDFVNLNDGWLCTYQGKIYKTTNSAVNWTEQFSNDSKSLYKIHFVNENTGWVVGDSGSIIKTTNAGVNWYKQSTPTDKDLYGIFMVSPTEGWICGERYILHTTDGGGPIGIQPISSEIPICFSLSQNYPNPFNPVTKIKFSLPVPSKGGVYMVQLVIYDILGRKVASLIPPPGGGQEGLPPGVYEVEFNGSNYTSGVYFYKLIVFGASAPLSITKKMILLK